MGIKLKKNKKFGYEPRHYDDNGEGNVYEFSQKFDKYRSTIGARGGIKSKIKNAFGELRERQDKDVTIRLAIILSVLVLGFLFIIDFDLSIFSF